jgi:hypothetical protein
MLSKLRRLYRGLCWLMDVDCGMPWDMASLGELREQVTALGEKADRNGECICLSEVDIAAVAQRLTALENQTLCLPPWPYACNIEPNAEDEAQHVYASVTDTDTMEVYEGRLPLTNAGQPDPEPAICSPLTKMGLTATTDAQFRKMAEYLVRGTEAAGAFDVQTLNAQLDNMGQTLPIAQSFKTRELYISALAECLQAYAKGAR